MIIPVSVRTVVASSKPKSEDTLRGCVNQSEMLRKLDLTNKMKVSDRNILYRSQPLNFIAVILKRLTYIIKGLYLIFYHTHHGCNSQGNGLCFENLNTQFQKFFLLCFYLYDYSKHIFFKYIFFHSLVAIFSLPLPI